MKKQFLLFIGLLLSLSSFAQIQFEKGYFIDNNGKRTECLIRNMDWYDNPKEFIYKISENGKEELIGVQSVNEFGIGDQIRFIRFSGQIDQSSSNLDRLSADRNPEYKTETVFLNVLLEGKANLYYYQAGTLKRYFFKTDSNNIEQLVYKKYKLDDGIQVNTNFAFRQQLFQNLTCKELQTKVKTLNYDHANLLKFFVQYHECVGAKIRLYQVKKDTKKLVNFSLRPGINLSSMKIDDGKVDFGNQITFRMGAELEFVFPFNKNKWSFIIEPNFQYYTSSVGVSSMNYKSIEIPLGFRYYMFLNPKSKLFINVSTLVDIPFGSSISLIPVSAFTSKMGFNYGWCTGIGYNYCSKYSVELRRVTREINYLESSNTNFQYYSLVLGINVLGFRK